MSVDRHLEAEADRSAERAGGVQVAGPVGAVRPMPPLDQPAGVPRGSVGVPLDTATRTALEPQLGWDLTQVRVHTGRAAAEAADALGAQAYTVGRHVVLGTSAGSGPDQRLLAHELTHVVQQARGAGRGLVHRKPRTAARPGPRKPLAFEVSVREVMTPDELLREFVRQYYATTSDKEVDRRLPLWRWQKRPGRSVTSADVDRGVVVLKVTDVTQAVVDQLSEAEQAAVNKETDERFLRESGLPENTRLGTGPEDAALRKRWLGARADIMREREQRREMADLPAEIKLILFAGKRQVTPDEYDEVLRLADKLGKLTKAQRMDYLSKVNSGTTSWADLDASIDRFVRSEQIRENESVRTDAAAATLFGCEDLYRAFRERNRQRLLLIQNAPYVAYAPDRLRLMDEANSRFDVALARHGFANEAAFHAAVETYRLRFREEAVTLALDILARYDHMLYEERLKLQDPANVETIVAGIAQTSARADYTAARENESMAQLVRFGAESPYERARAGAEAARYTARAADLRASAGRAVVAASGKDPLVDPEKLGRGTDREKLARLDAPAAQEYLLDVIQERLSDTAKARAEFTYDRDRIFSLPELVAATKKTQDIGDDTIYAWIVDDYVAEQQAAHVFSAVVLGILALVLAVLVPGGGWLAAAALVANTALSAYQALEAVQEYRRQGVEYRLAFIQEEPSLVWVAVAVAAAALDLGMTTAALLKMSAKGLSGLEGPLREFAAASDIETAAARFKTLTAKIRAAEGLEPELKSALEARAAAELGLKRVIGKLGGRLMGIGGGVDPTPFFEALYYAIKKGASSITKLRKEARLLELMGDVTKLSGAQRAELTAAFEQVQEVVKLGGKRGMDDATVLRFVDRLAAERSAGQGAVEALLEDMNAWRRPTQEQIRAEARLAEASEQLASLRRTRAELEAELRAGPRTPTGARDDARIKELREELAELDDVARPDRSGVGRLQREGLITRAERELRTAEALAEAARLDPTVRMRQVFGASKERLDIVSAAKVDQVGPLRTPPGALEVDHVVSLKRMSQMEGFDKLRAVERNALAVRRDNLVLMDASANASKGERSWGAWSQSSAFYGPDTVTHWLAEDARLTTTIQDWISATVRGR